MKGKPRQPRIQPIWMRVEALIDSHASTSVEKITTRHPTEMAGGDSFIAIVETEDGSNVVSKVFVQDRLYTDRYGPMTEVPFGQSINVEDADGHLFTFSWYRTEEEAGPEEYIDHDDDEGDDEWEDGDFDGDNE